MHTNVLATATFEEILDDLSSRFIINVPEAEQQSPERICFQVEQAHWFYEDFVRLLQPSLPSFQLKTFSEKIFKHCPLMKQWAHQHERAYADFMQYRFRIPVCGAILLNENLDKCVLVKGWSSKSGWSFPRGKINQDEEYDHCAIREVLEETGYDISPLIKETYLEATIREQSIRLYVICGVPEDTEFRPQTRKEISQVEWFKLDELPGIKPGTKATGRFYMVVPFVCKLKSALPAIRKEYYRPKGGKLSKNNNQKASRNNNYNNNKKSNNNNNGKKASPTSAVRTPPSPPQDNSTTSSSSTSTTPEPSVALKSLLGISPSVTPAPSSTANLTTHVATAAAATVTSTTTTTLNGHVTAPIPTSSSQAPAEPSFALKSLLGIQKSTHSPEASRSASCTSTSSSTPEQSTSTETTLLQMLQRAQPPAAPPPVSSSYQQQELHPLMQMFQNAGHEVKKDTSSPMPVQQQELNPLMQMFKNAGHEPVKNETATNENGPHPLIALLKGAERPSEETSAMSSQ